MSIEASCSTWSSAYESAIVVYQLAKCQSESEWLKLKLRVVLIDEKEAAMRTQKFSPD